MAAKERVAVVEGGITTMAFDTSHEVTKKTDEELLTFVEFSDTETKLKAERIETPLPPRAGNAFKTA